MKKRILRIIILISVVSGIVALNGGFKDYFNPSTVRAFGDLLVNFHVPPGTPIFNESNIAPGFSETKPVDVTNNGIVSRFVSVRGIRKNGNGTNPKIETALDFVIKNGSTAVYGNGSPTGPKTISDFFQDSLNTNGIMLNNISPTNFDTYNFIVTFPTLAGNAFQGKSVVFDLTFGVITANNVVINEVFYNVDDKHGLKEPKDRDEENEDRTNKLQNIKPKTRFKYQWVELYNPTNRDISLKNWKLITNSGRFVTINSNSKIKAGGFIILSKDSSLWKFWKDADRKEKIDLGHYFGDGLDIDGDHLILKDSQGSEVDRMSWGNDTSGFTPPGTNPTVAKGHSTERKSPGFDTDAAADWHDQNPPTPGN